MITELGVEFFCKPAACIEKLSYWSYEPQYVEIDGLRQTYVDAGSIESGETILLLHGQPSWAYQYSHMIRFADRAFYRTRQDGKKLSQYYSPEMSTKALN